MPWYLSDSLWFWFFEVFIIIFTIFALAKNKFREKSPISHLSRGKISRNFLFSVTAGVMTFIVTVIFTITNFPKDGLVLLYLLNLFCIFYLCVINNWSTNKLIGLLTKLEKHNYNPHRNN